MQGNLVLFSNNDRAFQKKMAVSFSWPLGRTGPMVEYWLHQSRFARPASSRFSIFKNTFMESLPEN